MYTIISDEERRNTVQNKPMVEEKVRNALRFRYGRRYPEFEIRVANRDDDDVLVVLHRFRKWSRDFQGIEDEGRAARKIKVCAYGDTLHCSIRNFGIR